MPALPTYHEELFRVAQARRDRVARREDDLSRRASAAAGDRHPTADELLRGHPLQGGDFGRDVAEFVARASDGLADADALESLRRLASAVREAAPGVGDGGGAALRALRACCIAPEADPDGTLRLRCVIYAALLGDVEAARAVAAEAALAAYVQDWHLEGDGSDLVWQSAAWSAFAAACVGPFRRLPYTISEMTSARERVDAFADEFQMRVGRLSAEVR